MSCKNCNLTFHSLSEERAVDLEERLRANSCVSTAETAQIVELTADVKADLESCDTEISRLNHLIFTLENKRQEMKSRENAYRSLLAPIRRLSTEVLSIIFSHCCRNGTLLPIPAPALFTLGTVCTYWRSIILSTPTLWSTISTYVNDTPRMFNIKLLDHYLEHSSQLPLTIKVDCDFDMESLVMEHLLPHSHRWRDINLHLAGSEARATYLHAMSGNLPMVEILALDFGESDFDAHDGADFFESMPKLHTLFLDWRTLGMVFPWTQIIHLSLSDTPIREFLRLVSIRKYLPH